MLRIPHCLDNRLTDGGKVVSPTHLPYFTPQKHYFSASGTHFCQRLSKPLGLVRPEGLGKFKNSPHTYTYTQATEFVLYKTNSVALVRERTIPTEKPPLIGEVSANFCG
jgi:hypothetical protein